MPELPEVEALAHWLDARTRGASLNRLELGSFSALKTVQPRLEDLVGQSVVTWERRGKFLCLRAERAWLVIHFSRAGWVSWHDRLPAAGVRPGRGPLVLRIGLLRSGGETPQFGFDITEAGTERRLALWVVDRPKAVPGIANLGLEPLAPGFAPAVLAERLGAFPGNLKSALTDQSLLAGVGNAYSDEVLHAARLSPFRPARALSPQELDQLHRALRQILSQAVSAAMALPADELKAEKRRGLQVHGRTGLPCPSCGETIREVAFATRSLQYCPSCQTQGRRLADRRLSRLLK